MSSRRIVANVFSNWVALGVAVAIGFIVSPIMVRSLGNETYGLWTLIVSVTGYFTVLDFGVNSAIVRFVSMYSARGEKDQVQAIVSSALVFFAAIGAGVMLVTVSLGWLFGDVFGVESQSRSYVYVVLLLVGTNMALMLFFSVLSGTLTGLQEFVKLNAINILTNVLKNTAIVALLVAGYQLLAIAAVQLVGGFLQWGLQYLALRRGHPGIQLRPRFAQRAKLKEIFDYSTYSFVIAISSKLISYTDSIVIGAMLSVEWVTFYAIPAMILDYLQKLFWSIVAVLIPVMSAKEALGEKKLNQRIYLTGTRYTMALVVPIAVVLLLVGDDFITVWMGAEYGEISSSVLRILVVGYAFSLSQLIAQGVLRAISKHAVLAWVLALEAGTNLVLSVMLVRAQGIEGVALGTTLPMLASKLVVIPWYTCRVLDLGYVPYMWKSYAAPLSGAVLLLALGRSLDLHPVSYLEIGLYSMAALVLMIGFSFAFVLESQDRRSLMQWIRTVGSK